jgi:hypothetical protein
MTWRLYALTSGGAVVVAALGALLAPATKSTQTTAIVEPQAVDRSGSAVDLGAQAERLKERLAVVTAYQQPGRDAFRFAPPPRRAVPPPVVEPVIEIAPAAPAPARPPYALSGMATTVEEGVTRRTAILSSLQGVSLVKEGDVLDAYRVASIADDAVTLESTVDGTQTTLRLSTD